MEARFQRFINKNIWNFSKEAKISPVQTEKRDGVNLENPYVPLNGFTLTEILGGGRPSTSGIIVGPNNALKLSAVWRCVSILSGIFSYLPKTPFIEQANGGRIKAVDHPTYKLFTRRPSPLYTKTVYWERAMIHLLLRGNHYAEIIFKGSEIVRFDLIMPTSVKSVTMNNGILYYKIEGRDLPIPADRIIHVPHLGEDPIMGKSTIQYAREDLGIEIARRDAGGRFWYDGGDPKGMIVTANKLTPTQEAALKDSFREKKREGGTIVAPFGVDYKQISMSPADQEFIMSGNFSIAAICRWFGVPLHKLSELERATLNNIEQMAIEFLQDTIAPFNKKFEDEYTTKCYTLPDESAIELISDMSVYQKADRVTMAQFNQSAIQNGYKSINEVRKENNDPSIEGGDQNFIQLNMQTVANAVKPKQPMPPLGAKSLKENLRQNVRALVDLFELEDKQNGNGHH